MGFFDKVKSGFSELTDEAQKLLHKNFLHAMTAASAMVAASDGNIDQCEKDKMLSFGRILWCLIDKYLSPKLKVVFLFVNPKLKLTR